MGARKILTNLAHPQRLLSPLPDPFAKVRGGPFSKILMDVPGAYNKSTRGSAEKHYPTMSVDELKRLPVQSLGARDSVLFYWTTAPLLMDGSPMAIMKSYGYTPKTIAFNWVKTNEDGSIFMGMGDYTRANAEYCLIGIRGRPRRHAKNISSIVMARRQEHSRKPDDIHGMIDALYQGPGIELFARRPPPRDGWTVWGNEV